MTCKLRCSEVAILSNHIFPAGDFSKDSSHPWIFIQCHETLMISHMSSLCVCVCVEGGLVCVCSVPVYFCVCVWLGGRWRRSVMHGDVGNKLLVSCLHPSLHLSVSHSSVFWIPEKALHLHLILLLHFVSPSHLTVHRDSLCSSSLCTPPVFVRLQRLAWLICFCLPFICPCCPSCEVLAAASHPHWSASLLGSQPSHRLASISSVYFLCESNSHGGTLLIRSNSSYWKWHNT